MNPGLDKWKLRPTERLHIACEDLDLSFTAQEVWDVTQWWNEGMSYDEIAASLNRDGDEVAILLIDLARKGRIRRRRGGCRG